MKKTLLLSFFAALLLAACEKPYTLDTPSDEKNANVTLRVSNLELIPFETISTRAATDVAEICSRLNFAIFQGGERIKSISQKKEDASFGTISINLSKGEYEVVVIAHSCDGSATISTPSKITFPNNKLTDTFYYYGTLNVGTSAISQALELKRAVAMFRLSLKAPLPSNVSMMQFYYTGGSSTFSAATGYGNVNSRQTENISVAEGQQQFEVFTFPHEETGALKMTVTAHDATGTIIEEHVFENVPVQRNFITQYTGNFGTSTSSPTSAFTIRADNAWGGQNDYNY